MAKRRSALMDFLSGMVSIFSIFPPYEPTPVEIRLLAEQEALAEDLQKVCKDFGHAFSQLAHYVSKEKPVNKWNNTENIKPPISKYVLGYFHDGQHRGVRWDGYMWSDCDGEEFDAPTHWTELPEPPDEEKTTEEAEFQIAKQIADHLHWILREDPDLINRLVLSKEMRENPPTIIGLLNRMFKSGVRIVYIVDDDDEERVTRICAVRQYPPSHQESDDFHDLLA